MGERATRSRRTEVEPKRATPRAERRKAVTTRGALIQKIRSHEAKVGIIGLGYVGLPLVLRFAEVGFEVIGFDVDPTKVDELNGGRSYIRHVPGERVSEIRKAGNLEATTDFHRLDEPDCIIICVPTPLTSKREPDLQYIEKTAEAISGTLRKGQLIALESTTYPGTTREVLESRFSESGLKAGEDYFLAYSPEREDPGNGQFSTASIPKVVGGSSSACLAVATALYGEAIERIVPVSSTETAELVKLLENIYRSVNIALVNELKMLTDRMDIDVWEVIDAASTKPFGFTPFYPGPGLGGHCIPIDPFYLSWKAREHGFATRFIELAGEVNTAIPRFVVEKVGCALNDRGKAVRDSRILILGVAYKRDVEDVRESPSLELMTLLQERGAKLSFHDPYVARLHRMRNYDFSHLSSQELTPELITEQDAVLIATDHSGIDYEWVARYASLLIDTRNATKSFRKNWTNIVMA